MHTYSLTLKSRGLEKEYHLQQVKYCIRQSKPLLFIYLVIGFVNLVYLSFYQISTNNSSNNLSANQFYFVLAFAIAWIVSVVVSLILLYYQPNKFNIFYSTQQFINIFYHLVLINFELNISDSVSSKQNCSTTTDSTSSSSKSLIQFHILEGFLLAIILNRGFLGTKFLVKAALCVVTLVSLVFISINELEKPYIQIPFGFACLGIILSQIYEDDKNKRSDFLVSRKDEEWNKIIKNVLPTNFIIAKYNAKESRVELEQANKKANRELGITNNDNFQKFTKSTLVQKNEIISNEKDLNRILKCMTQQIPMSLNGILALGQQNPSQTNQKDFTLHSLIRQKIEEELNSKRKVSLGHKLNMDGYIDSISDAIQTTVGGFFGNRSKKKSIQSSQIGQNNAYSHKKVSEFIGTYRPNGFDVDKKLLIRVSTFSLNEVFAVITIENETYREKYIKQIKFSTFLEKIFSFQLKKFKESYMVVLNELNRINNPQVHNQLLYHNVKCMNRVNSYLQYFEFKNSTKHEFSVTEFSLTSEIYKILRSLKHYIVGKRIRTFYENTTSFDKISTDEERLQQIFFMILEHLMVNSPPDGYIAIRVTNDQTISNCFKIQIQSTYNSTLINQINLQTFNIDELYNDYEIYQNYFVSLRIAIKLITLMGPYNKIEFTRSDKNILFTSFSIFSDLEVIKTQQIKTQQNLNVSQMKFGSVSNTSPLQQQQQQQQFYQYQPLNQLTMHQQPTSSQSPHMPDTSQFAGGTTGLNGVSQLGKNQSSINNNNLNNANESAYVNRNPSNRHDSIKNQDNSTAMNNFMSNKRYNQTTLNNINSANDLNESGNVSEMYDEQSSFNQWFKLKQLQHSSLANQKVFEVIGSNLPNPATKQTVQKNYSEKDSIIYQPIMHNRSSGSGDRSNSLNKSVLLSDILTEDHKDFSKCNNLTNFRTIPNSFNQQPNTTYLSEAAAIVGENTQAAVSGNSANGTVGHVPYFNDNILNMSNAGGAGVRDTLPNFTIKQNLKTIYLNDDIDVSQPINPLLNYPQSNKSARKKFSLIDRRSQITNSPNLQYFDSQRQLNSILLLNNTSTQLYNTNNNNNNNQQLLQYNTESHHKTSISQKQNQYLSKTNSYSSRQEKELLTSFTKHPNNVYSAGELGNDSEFLPLQNNQSFKKPLKKRSKF